MAAAREGHAHVVAELLVRGANVHHRSCPEDDVHETAEGAAQRWAEASPSEVTVRTHAASADAII